MSHVVAITHNVKISVETFYQSQAAVDPSARHMFAYRIRIQNQGEHTIRLLRRHWYIIDPINGNYEVEGEGVVGKQPVLEPGESHQYISGCALGGELGKMYGTYLMERQFDGKLFEVEIPAFQLVVPFVLN
ncbi:MAG: Co2+/Mg2+ efflux protein ApaG [Bacteroidetes bacterium]|nr:Co2+/Mg2+ efflux protein ApaG [Bacteroidota bacterium]MCK6609814.1 Co2+/Mg2+ efflux protein ApaG [Bacteroidia bacterium]